MHKKVTFGEKTRRKGKKLDKIIVFTCSLICLFIFSRIIILELVGGTSCSQHQCKSHKHYFDKQLDTILQQTMHFDRFPSHVILIY